MDWIIYRVGWLAVLLVAVALLSPWTKNFYRQVVHEAWLMSWKSTAVQMGGCFIAALTAVVGWWWWLDDSGSVARNALTKLAGGVLFFIGFLFLFNLVMAPVRLDRRKQDEEDKLRSRLDKYEGQSEFEVTASTYGELVMIEVSNHGPTADFEAQVIHVQAGLGTPSLPKWYIRWQDRNGQDCRILNGNSASLELAWCAGPINGAPKVPGLQSGTFSFHRPGDVGDYAVSLGDADGLKDRDHVSVTVRVSSIAPRRDIEKMFGIGLEFEEGVILARPSWEE
jgi:hypothetical protein